MKCKTCGKDMYSTWNELCSTQLTKVIDVYIFTCYDCKAVCNMYQVTVRTDSRLIKLMLDSESRLVNKLGLLLAKDYEIIEDGMIIRSFRKNRVKKHDME